MPDSRENVRTEIPTREPAPSRMSLKSHLIIWIPIALIVALGVLIRLSS